ncbi:hypothetical protein [Leclercia sp. W17]|uniref:hypothetical protein n=1 Tax=Leclercia sp. W17 TaxID=2282309 RepID=UPI000DF17343|nr:hypothetical protein [Leclercia sp. W17]AXF64449.1 hypothetical protein DVA44_10165 [Leclercia sp. W17]
MKFKNNYLLLALMGAAGVAQADSFGRIIENLDRPYAVTVNKDYDIRCIWTKDDNGYLQSENTANEGTGICWDKKAVDEAEKLNESGKLKWITPVPIAEFYTDLHNACFYGYMGKHTGNWETYLADKYAKMVSKYRVQPEKVGKIGKSFDFGKDVASTTNDCSFIAKKMFTGE